MHLKFYQICRYLIIVHQGVIMWFRNNRVWVGFLIASAGTLFASNCAPTAATPKSTKTSKGKVGDSNSIAINGMKQLVTEDSASAWLNEHSFLVAEGSDVTLMHFSSGQALKITKGENKSIELFSVKSSSSESRTVSVSQNPQSAWEVFNTGVQYIGSAADGSQPRSGSLTFANASLSSYPAFPKVLSANSDGLLLHGEGFVQYFYWTEAKLNAIEAKLGPLKTGKIVAGGFFQDKSPGFWIGDTQKVYLGSLPEKGIEWKTIKLPESFEASTSTYLITLPNGKSNSVEGSKTALTSKGFLSSDTSFSKEDLAENLGKVEEGPQFSGPSGSSTPIAVASASPTPSPTQMAGTATPTPAATATAAPLTYATVKANIDANCALANCHNAAQTGTGKPNLSTLTAIKSMCRNNMTCRARMAVRLNAGQMPPGQATFKDTGAGKDILTWLNSNLD